MLLLFRLPDAEGAHQPALFATEIVQANGYQYYLIIKTLLSTTKRVLNDAIDFNATQRVFDNHAQLRLAAVSRFFLLSQLAARWLFNRRSYENTGWIITLITGISASNTI